MFYFEKRRIVYRDIFESGEEQRRSLTQGRTVSRLYLVLDFMKLRTKWPITICISILRFPATPWQEEQSVGEAVLGGWQDFGLIPGLEDIPSSEALFLLFIRYRGKVAAVQFNS